MSISIAALFRLGLASAILAGLGLTSPVLAQSTVYIPAILELSGAGAVSGTNFRDGMLLAIDEINAKGGILGRKIDTPLLDTQSDAGISRAQVQKVLDNNPYVILGPVFSGSVLVDMALTHQAEIPEIVGGEAAAITQKGDPYVFRTSFGQQFSMPKIANYIRDSVKAKSVAVLWVNNDFGKGGRDTFIKEMAARNIKVTADISTESGQADFSADVVKIKAANADAIFVYVNEEESARFLREAKKQGVKTALIGETTLLGQKVIDLAQGAAEGVAGPRRPHGRCADPCREGVRRTLQEALQLCVRSQRHQGLHRRLFHQARHRENGQVRQQAVRPDPARHDDHAEGRARRPDGSDIRQERRH